MHAEARIEAAVMPPVGRAKKLVKRDSSQAYKFVRNSIDSTDAYDYSGNISVQLRTDRQEVQNGTTGCKDTEA